MDVRGPAPALVKYELTESRDGLVEIYVNPAMVAYIAWLPPLA